MEVENVVEIKELTKRINRCREETPHLLDLLEYLLRKKAKAEEKHKVLEVVCFVNFIQPVQFQTKKFASLPSHFPRFFLGLRSISSMNIFCSLDEMEYLKLFKILKFLPFLRKIKCSGNVPQNESAFCAFYLCCNGHYEIQMNNFPDYGKGKSALLLLSANPKGFKLNEKEQNRREYFDQADFFQAKLALIRRERTKEGFDEDRAFDHLSFVSFQISVAHEFNFGLEGY